MSMIKHPDGSVSIGLLEDMVVPEEIKPVKAEAKPESVEAKAETEEEAPKKRGRKKN